MGLKPQMQIRLIDEDFPHFRTSERGGVLTLSTVSGIDYADYSINPSGKLCLGIKLNDHEWIEDDRQNDQSKYRRVESMYGPAKIALEGDVITDWVHPDYSASIKTGDVAYVGPSGTLINSNDYNSDIVGMFQSKVNSSHYGLNHHDSYLVLFEGGGLTYTWMDPDTHEVTTINATQTRIPIGGWVRLRIKPERAT